MLRLLRHGLEPDADLNQDRDGDDVNLLMAYALDLDPNLNELASRFFLEKRNGSSARNHKG